MDIEEDCIEFGNIGNEEDFLVDFGIGNIDAVESMSRTYQRQYDNLIPPTVSDIPDNYPISPLFPDPDNFNPGFDPTAKKNNITY